MWWIKLGGTLFFETNPYFMVPSDVPFNYGNFIWDVEDVESCFKHWMNPLRSPPRVHLGEAKKKKQKMSLAEALDRQKKEAEAPWWLSQNSQRFSVTRWEDRGPKTREKYEICGMSLLGEDGLKHGRYHIYRDFSCLGSDGFEKNRGLTR